MTLWEFGACVSGWNRANSSDDAALPPPSPEEHDALIAKYG